MSCAAMTWAFEQNFACQSYKLVLLALADHAAADGSCFPSVATLARRAGCSRATVFRALAYFEEQGLMSRSSRYATINNGQVSSVYQLHLNAVCVEDPAGNDNGQNSKNEYCPPSQDETPPVSPCDPPRLTGETPPVSTVRPLKEPPIEPPSEPRNKTRCDVDERTADLFEQFWLAFPKGRKVDKPKAKKLFARILAGKHADFPDPPTGEQLIQAASSYAARRPDPQFVPMPTTWLNGGRWSVDHLEDLHSAKRRVSRY